MRQSPSCSRVASRSSPTALWLSCSVRFQPSAPRSSSSTRRTPWPAATPWRWRLPTTSSRPRRPTRMRSTWLPSSESSFRVCRRC
ncbi:MAG: hypothetical protein MZV64_28660 [Ignavibacteriales bacterium]|nr:hypothetical protein [Ignavibacteriales bacterium]